MPAILPIDFPAATLLRKEGQTPLTRGADNATPHITIGFINLMPNKIDTELDFLRLINPYHRNVDFRPIRMASHRSRHADPAHLDRFYSTFPEIAQTLDGVIITGAPLDDVPFEQVTYWREITAIMDHLHNRRIPIYALCWGAFAALYHWWHIGWTRHEKKLSGVYPNQILHASSPIIQGLNDGFEVPFSRFVAWDAEEVAANPHTCIVCGGERQGPYIVASLTHPEYYITGHAEYSATTLHNEYTRDLGKGLNPSLPENYYTDNDTSRIPHSRWTPAGLTIMANWLDEVDSCRIKRLNNQSITQ